MKKVKEMCDMRLGGELAGGVSLTPGGGRAVRSASFKCKWTVSALRVMLVAAGVLLVLMHLGMLAKRHKKDDACECGCECDRV